MVRLVGRAREQRVLTGALRSREAELVAIHGRRRVGKTYLVREFFAGDICFELTGMHDASLRQQLQNFADALSAALGAPLPLAPPSSWREAFQQLASFLESRPDRDCKLVVFLDELPWLASRRSGFLGALEHFWNSWAVKQRRLVVVVSGSASAWMVQRLLHARGGLHNRVTRRVRLEPFTLLETEQYLSSASVEVGRYQLLELYMALGGVPYYLRQVERGESAAANIDRLCFAREGPLRDEFDKLYASLFEHAERHVAIVRALAARPHGLGRGELIAATKLKSGGTMSQALDELEESGFILRVPRFGFESKEATFRLIDEYSLFYLKWIERQRSRAANIWINKRGTPAWRAWSGYAFEGLCLKHVGSLKRALGIEAVETRESAWQQRGGEDGQRGAQIDLLIDRKDATINLCEMKFSEAEFVIDKRYADELRNKRDVFRRATGSKKALLISMVTCHGVRENSASQAIVDKSLSMDALFLS